MDRFAVLVFLPQREFPGAAFLAFIDGLANRGVPFVVASARAAGCAGTGGVRALASHEWDEPALGRHAALVAFDDSRGSVAASPDVRRHLLAAHEARHPVGAVGAGVGVLAAAGLTGRVGVITASEAGAGALAEDLLDVALGYLRPDPPPP
jgi:hypothetical protein